ncbi:hypothetical protein [Mogibacterium diversum]|uniref:hypothetical protein n=1 Tax=Mogibacterium diversum TaxID=114527 RepID=UPI0026EEC503|nr:hypothetical protein [Mogibacterium diversum]
MVSFIEKARKWQLKYDIVSDVEKVYGCELPDDIKHIVSCKNDEFISKWARVLSVEEILSANEIMQIDFIGKKLVPLLDILDNDFIAYDIEHKKYVSINIVEDMVFDSSENIDDLIPQDI